MFSSIYLQINSIKIVSAFPKRINEFLTSIPIIWCLRMLFHLFSNCSFLLVRLILFCLCSYTLLEKIEGSESFQKFENSFDNSHSRSENSISISDNTYSCFEISQMKSPCYWKVQIFKFFSCLHELENHIDHIIYSVSILFTEF